MFLVDHIAEKIVDPIVDALLSCTVRQFGYVLHCNQNIDDFAKQVENLERAKRTVDRKIEEASNKGEVVVEEDVSEWVKKVELLLPTMEDDKKRLVQAKENVQCLDVLSRYRMGKEGKKKQPDVTTLVGEERTFEAVAHRPPLTATWGTTYSIKYESVKSRELLFQQIMEALKDDKIYKIGIYGMPGVGKTRMMEEVAKQAKEQGLFDDLGEMVVTQNPEKLKIQQKLADSLNLNLKLDEETEPRRKELLRNRLKNGKRIIVMVDDIWNDRIKLEDIGIPAEDDHTPGGKVLLTSRRKDVCEHMGVKDPFQIGVLSKDEAWSLFEKKVGDFNNHPQMRSIAEEVCGRCAGLPLAILAVGGALMNKKSQQEWNDALHQLTHSSGDNIGEQMEDAYSSIKLSYDCLKPSEAKSIFLLCCVFPEDADISIDELAMYAFARKLLRNIDTMENARNRAHAVINTLKTHCLLLEGKSDAFVKMHDVIRDVAIFIASKNKDDTFLVKSSVGKWPEEEEYIHCCTISLQLNEDFVFPYELQCPELRCLRLEYNGFHSSAPSRFFNGMHKLEVLCLHDISISTLPSYLKHLRMLSLYNYGSVDLAFLKELEKLEILSIEDNHVKELAPEIKLLTSLRLLNLSNCNRLKMVPVISSLNCNRLKMVPSGVISSLSELEELYLPEEFDQWEMNGNASLDELKSLKCLTSLQIHVPNGLSLPLDEFRCKSLVRFIISIGSTCYSDERLSSATKILKLEDTPLKREIIILMEKAEVLILMKLEGLKDVFHNKEFLDLMHLEVVYCDGVDHLFGNPKLISQINGLPASYSFSKLTILQVYHCEMRSLFSTTIARGLAQLQELSIGDCEMLEEIMCDDQEAVDISFHRLKKLSLWRLPNLRGFSSNTKKMSTMRCNNQPLFNNEVSLPALEELYISQLDSLRAIWDNQSFVGSEAHYSFCQLKSVNVEGCDKIVNVIPPNVVPWFQNNLRELKVKSCDSVISVVEVTAFEEGGDEILMFPQLKTLKLEKLQKLQSFCYSNSGGGSIEEENSGKTFVFPQLNKLALKELPMLRSFCSSRRGGEEIVVVEEKEGNIPQPQLFNHKVHLLSCEEFTMEDCSSVEVIFNLDGLDKEKQATMFSQIKKLELHCLPKLERIWMKEPKGLLVFHNLTSLEVRGCNKLRYVFSLSIARCLTQLRELNIWSCSEMEEIVRSEGQGEKDDMDQIVFPQLQKLWFHELQNLTCFSRRTNAFNFPSLNDATLRECPKLETFTFGRISTPVITDFGVNYVWRDYEELEEDVTIDLNKEVHEILKEILEDKREEERGGPSHNDVVRKEDIDDSKETNLDETKETHNINDGTL